MQNPQEQAELEAAQAELLENPNLADSWNRVAIVLLKLGDLKTAVEHIGHAIRLEPTEPLHYSNRGRLLFALRLPEESLADYSKAIELEPTAELYASRSVVNLTLGKEAAALADLNEAIELNPSIDNLINRAIFFSNKGMATDALRDMNRVVELQPDNPNYHLTRANLAFALAQHYPELNEIGITDIEAAIKLDTTGELNVSLQQLADQLEANLPYSLNPEVSRRLIDLIRAAK